MKTVIITAGPQGAGKSTYCKKIVAENPDIRYISRDEIIRSEFGDNWCGYTGVFQDVMRIIWQRTRVTLQNAARPFFLIVDCWNSTAYDRELMALETLNAGADRVIVWYFVTPEKTCIKWFLQREQPNSSHTESESKTDNCRFDFRRYHESAHDLRLGLRYLYTVKHINPLQLILPGMPLPL